MLFPFLSFYLLGALYHSESTYNGLQGALVHVAAHKSMQPGQETSLDSTWASQRSHTSDKVLTCSSPTHSLLFSRYCFL